MNANNYAAYVVTGACNENGQAVTIGGTLSGSGTCDGSNYTATVNYTAIADGAGTISISADMDDAANDSATQATATLGKDIVAPAVALTNTGWINAANVSAYDLTGTCTDATSGVGTVASAEQRQHQEPVAAEHSPSPLTIPVPAMVRAISRHRRSECRG